MKLGKLANPKFTTAMNNLMQTKWLPVKTAFKFRTIAKNIQAEVEKYEDMKNSYIQELAERNDDGSVKVEVIGANSMIKFEPAKLAEFNKRMAELADIEVPVAEINVTDLPNVENLTLDDIYQLEFIVE